MTFEDVDKHVNAVDLTKLTAVHASASSVDLCATYKAVKPILALVEAMPFFPAKWGLVLKSFTTVLDQLCP